jgi:hypothetical protein
VLAGFVRAVPFFGSREPLVTVADAMSLDWMTNPDMVRVWEHDVTRGVGPGPLHRAWDVGPDAWSERVMMRGHVTEASNGDPVVKRAFWDEELGKLLLWGHRTGEMTDDQLVQLSTSVEEWKRRQDSEVARARVIERKFPMWIRQLESSIEDDIMDEEVDLTTDSLDNYRSTVVADADETVRHLDEPDDEEVAEKYREEWERQAEESYQSMSELLDSVRGGRDEGDGDDV